LHYFNVFDTIKLTTKVLFIFFNKLLISFFCIIIGFYSYITQEMINDD